MNSDAFPHLAVVGISLAVNATSQIMLRRTLGSRVSVFCSALIGFLCGAVVMAGAEMLLAVLVGEGQQGGWLLLGDAMMYACAGYCWLHYVNIGEASVRLRMAREIMDAEPRGLTREELAERYGVDHMIDVRLGRLTATGELALRDGRYYFQKPRMLVVARAFAMLRRVVLDDSFAAVRATKAAERFGENEAGRAARRG